MTEDVRTREELMRCIAGDNPFCDIVDSFARYVDPTLLGRFLTRYELFKKVLGIHGSIIECGVRNGGGFMQWYQMSKLLEPLNGRRIVYGFDTFAGLASVDAEKDGPLAHNGDQLVFNMLPHLNACITMAQHQLFIADCHNSNLMKPDSASPRHQWRRCVPIVGDFMETGIQFLLDHPHVMIALLYLDFDVYRPTKLALELFLPRMPKGAVVAFDELDHPDWPGETRALLDTVGVSTMRIERFPWEPSMGYCVL